MVVDEAVMGHADGDGEGDNPLLTDCVRVKVTENHVTVLHSMHRMYMYILALLTQRVAHRHHAYSQQGLIFCT